MLRFAGEPKWALEGRWEPRHTRPHHAFSVSLARRFDSLGQTSLGTRIRAKITDAFRHRVALTVALLLVPIGQCELIAQQAAYYG